MDLMFAWDACGNQIGQCNCVVGGKCLEENVLRTFVCVFLILVMKVQLGSSFLWNGRGGWGGQGIRVALQEY
jgi:hypothetical protein